MGSCMSSSSSTSTHQDPNLAPGARPSKRWKWGHSERGLGKGLFDRLVDPEKGHSRRDGPTEDELQGIRGRLAVNGASGVACLFTQQGRKGPNQDAMVVWENFASREDTVFCGVFDGHGPYGHMVAKKVRDSLPVKVCNQWRPISDGHSISSQNVGGSANYEENASLTAEEEWLESIENKDFEKFPEVYRTLRQSLLKAFRLMDKELKLHPAIDCFCSGSTAVTLIKQGRDLIIGNLGDSRAVLGTRDKNGDLVALQLTVDLKPNLPREAARIQQCKGRVFALQDEPDVSRVWLPNSDSPGLAMARAFGDFCLKDYGLISVPDIRYRHLTDQDEFIILATDGIWDALSNKEVVDIVAAAPTRATAARTLVDCAVQEWRVRFPTSKIDDCAVVCLFLDQPSLLGQSQRTTNSQRMPGVRPEPITVGLTGQQLADKHDPHPLPDGYHPQGNAMAEMFPPVGIDEIEAIEVVKDVKLHNVNHPVTTNSSTGEEEWTALDGVTRVNTLLNVSRFKLGDARLTAQKS